MAKLLVVGQPVTCCDSDSFRAGLSRVSGHRGCCVTTPTIVTALICTGSDWLISLQAGVQTITFVYFLKTVTLWSNTAYQKIYRTHAPNHRLLCRFWIWSEVKRTEVTCDRPARSSVVDSRHTSRDWGAQGRRRVGVMWQGEVNITEDLDFVV